MKISDVRIGAGGSALIAGSAEFYADLPTPPSDYIGKFYLVQKPSGTKFAFSLKAEDWYKYPAGLYTPNLAATEWIQAPFSVQVSEDAQTLLNIPSGKWTDYFNIAVDIHIGDILIYDGKIYANLTGTQTATAPDSDSTNWGFMKLAVEWIDFNTSPGAVPSHGGRTYWNPDEYTLNIDTGIGPVLQVNQEDVEVVYNNTGDLISNGTAVNGIAVFNGFTSVVKADSTAFNGISNPCITTMDIPAGSYGICTTRGKLRGIDTTLIPGFGPLIYIDPTTPGGLTRTRPEFPDYRILLGAIVVDAVDGIININIKETARDTLFNTWDGSIRETFDFRVTSDGATITGSLTNPNAGSTDLTLILSEGFSIFDASAATITLTPGTATNPQMNYVYIPASTKVLTVSTTEFPADEHCKIAKLYLQDAVTSQAEGALRNQNINDHVKSDDDNGHLLHISERLRQFNAEWDNGCLGSLTGTPADIFFDITAGQVWQMHKQNFPAQDMSTGDNVHVINDPTTPYRATTNLNDITEYSDGSSWNNEWSNLVLWGVCNKTGEVSHIMVNLPVAGYTSESDAVEDRSNFTNYTIPAEFKGVGFLIGRYTIRRSGTTFTYNSGVGYLDLRGFIPNNTAGGSAGSSGITEFTGLTDTPSSYIGQALSILQVNAGETALEFTDSPTFENLTVNENVSIGHGIPAVDLDVLGRVLFTDDGGGGSAFGYARFFQQWGGGMNNANLRLVTSLGGANGLYSQIIANSSSDSAAVVGEAIGFGGNHWGGYFTNTSQGNSYGVYGEAIGAATINYGVYGKATGGTTNWAGYFEGDVYVSQNLNVAEHVTLENNKAFRVKNTLGSAVNLITLDLNDSLRIGDTVGADPSSIVFQLGTVGAVCSFVTTNFTFNATFQDIDFIVNKNSSGEAYKYNAGLDTHTFSGDTSFLDNVTISGNLTVNGTTITQDVEEILVKDNLMLLNWGETGAGVTAGISGTEVDRGTLAPFRWIFNETGNVFEVGGYYPKATGTLSGAFTINEEVIQEVTGARGYVFDQTGVSIDLKGVTGTFDNTNTITGQTSGETVTSPTMSFVDGLQPIATREDTPTAKGIAVWSSANNRFETSSSFTYDGADLLLSGGDVVLDNEYSLKIKNSSGTELNAIGININDNLVIGDSSGATPSSILFRVGLNGTVIATTTSKLTFNFGFDDYDFVIQKNTSGEAYRYDAGLDTHTFSGAASFDSAITVPSVLLDDTDSAFNLKLQSTSTITTADKTLTIDVNDSDRTLTIAGDATISNINTGDQDSIVGISGTKAEFDSAVTDGNFAYAGGAYHDGFSDYVAGEHFLQTAITNVSTALASGILTVTTGTGALSSITDNSSNWDAAYTHVSNNGSDHSFINQDVKTSATPQFTGMTMADALVFNETIPLQFKDSGGVARDAIQLGGSDILYYGNSVAFSEIRIGNIVWGNISLTSTETVINENGNNVDFRIEGDTEVNLFFTDASTNRVGIGTNTPSEVLDVVGNIAVSGTVDGIDLATVVVGPASATNNAIARFDLTTGKLIQNSSVTISDTGTITIPSGSAIDSGSGTLQLVNEAGLSNLQMYSHSNTVTHANTIRWYRSRGASASIPTAVTDTTEIGQFRFFAYDGSSYIRVCDFGCAASEDHSGSARGITFYVSGTPNGSTIKADWFILEDENAWFKGDVTSGGNLFIETIKSGATQAAASAAANEVWKTSGHATLPDNVLLIGV